MNDYPREVRTKDQLIADFEGDTEPQQKMLNFIETVWNYLSDQTVDDLAPVAFSGDYDDLLNTPNFGALAFKDQIVVGDIDADGTPGPDTYLAGDGEWKPIQEGAVAFATRAEFVAAVADTYDPDPGSTISVEGFTYIRVASATFIPDLPGWAPSAPFASPFHFGITGTGNETTLLTALHICANALALPVSYQGLASFSVNSTADIHINTSVDFAGTLINIIGGIVDPLNYASIPTFRVIDAATPLQTTGSGSVSGAFLYYGSITPTRGRYNGSGYAKIISTLTIPNREEDGTMVFEQPFWLMDGTALDGLAESLTSNTTMNIEYRVPSARRISINNVRLRDNGWNSLEFLCINRNQVDVKEFYVLRDSGRASASRNRIVAIRQCGDIELRDFKVSGQPGTGTYGIAFGSVANIRIYNFHGPYGPEGVDGSWGVTGANYINGVCVYDSHLNRFDVHALGFNISVQNCTFERLGIVMGSGGGNIHADRCTFYQACGFLGRNDYGRYFTNDTTIQFTNCTWYPDTSGNQNTFIFLGGSRGIGTTSVASTQFVPNVILRNLDVRAGAVGTITATILDVTKRNSATNSIVRPPQSTIIDGVRTDRNTILRARVDYGSYDIAGLASHRVFFSVRDWRQSNLGSYNSNSSTGGVWSRTSVVNDPTTAADVRFNMDGCAGIGCSFFTGVPTRSVITACEITHFHLASSSTQEVLISGSKFVGNSDFPLRVGGNNTSLTNSTKILACDFSVAVAYDLSDVRALSAVYTSTSTVLPGATTRAGVMQGWYTGI